MSRFLTSLALALPALLAAAPTVRADEPRAVRVALAAPDRWEKGETVTLKFTEEAVFRLTAESPGDGRPLPAKLVTVGFAGRYVVRCDDVDAAGRRTRALVHLAEWRHDTPDRRDRSIEGAFVEVTPAGWSLVGTLINPSPEARKWLDGEFGPGATARGTDLALLAPPPRVAVGDSWEADVRASLAALLDLTPIAVQARVTAFRPTLENAIESGGGAVVRIVGEMESPLAAEPGAPALAGDANVLRVRGEFSGVPTAWHRNGAVVLRGDLSLTADTGRTRVRCGGTLDRRRSASAGGRVPEPPAREAKAGPLVRIARRAPWHEGDAFAEVGRDASEGTVTPYDARGKAGKLETTGETIEWTAVHTCRELDEAGFPRRMSVAFREWSATTEETADTSLRGVTIEVLPGGWSLVPGAPGDAKDAPVLTKRAREWLDREFARTTLDDPVRAAVAPAMTVLVGDEWLPDAREVRGVVRSWLGLPLADADEDVRASLDAVEGDETGVVAKVSYRFALPIAPVGGPDSRNEDVLRGGTVDVEGETTGAAGEWERAGTLRETTKVSVHLPDGAAGSRHVESSRTRTRTRAPVTATGVAASVQESR